MKRIHIIGHKNSGKTTLIVDLVSHFAGRGLRVGTVKHTHHDHELDTPGKDSHRHRSAGAIATGIISQGLTAVFWPTEQEDSDARYNRLSSLFADCDLVLVEGHSQTSGTKVEVWRANVSEEPMAAQDPSIVSVITDDELDVAIPVWPRSSVLEIADQMIAVL